MSYQFRPLARNDAGTVASLIETSFAPKLRRFIPYCQPGVANYLIDHLEGSDASGSRPLEQVATDGEDRVVGHAELRSVGPHVAVLGYLSVDRRHRGRGLASDLIRSICRRAPTVDFLEIDVFDTNHSALSLYKRLGAVTSATKVWSVTKASGVDASDETSIVNASSSRASLQRYGFCQAEVAVGNRRIRYDLPSASVVRLSEPAAPMLLEGIAGLRGLTWVDEILTITPQETPVGLGPEGAPILRAYRLRSAVSVFLGDRSRT